MDGLRTEVCGQQNQSHDPRNNQHNPQYANYWAPLTRKRHIPHSPGTPTTGLCERGNDTSKSTGRSGRQNAATRRNTRRGERVTVQGPVKEQQPDGMSHGGGGGARTEVRAVVWAVVWALVRLPQRRPALRPTSAGRRRVRHVRRMRVLRPRHRRPGAGPGHVQRLAVRRGHAGLRDGGAAARGHRPGAGAVRGIGATDARVQPGPEPPRLWGPDARADCQVSGEGGRGV